MNDRFSPLVMNESPNGGRSMHGDGGLSHGSLKGRQPILLLRRENGTARALELFEGPEFVHGKYGGGFHEQKLRVAQLLWQRTGRGHRMFAGKTGGFSPGPQVRFT